MVVSGFAYFLANLDSFDSLAEKSKNLQSELMDLSIVIETEKNATSAEISTLLRARSTYRQDKEELEDNSIGDREEMNALERKIVKASEDLKNVQEDLDNKNAVLETLNAQVKEEEKKQEPLLTQKDELMQELEEVLRVNEQKRKEFEDVNVKVSKMKLIRKTASNNYESSSQSMMEEYVLPEFLFWGDRIEVLAESISPSGQGFFAKQGANDGIRTGFFFLASLGELGEEKPFFVKATLVEDAYSFLELEDDRLNFHDLLNSGQKLFLIRTGDSANNKSSEFGVDVALEVDSF